MFTDLKQAENYFKSIPFSQSWPTPPRLAFLSGKVISTQALVLSGQDTLFFKELKIGYWLLVGNEIVRVDYIQDNLNIVINRIILQNDYVDFYLVPNELKESLELEIKQKLYCLEKAYNEIINSSFYDVPKHSKDEKLIEAQILLARDLYNSLILSKKSSGIDLNNVKKLKIGDMETEYNDKPFNKNINPFSDEIQRLLNDYKTSRVVSSYKYQ